MNYRSLFLVSACLMAVSPAQADLYLELAIDGGGDELAGTTTGDRINAGGGVKLAIGAQNKLGDGSTALRFSAGYLFDTLDAIDGSADSSAITLDGMYLMNSGAHTFGVGATMHMSPEYNQTGGGYSNVNLEFDDAVGLVLEYQYTFSSSLGLGARYTNLTYKTGNLELDASSFGLFISTGF